jgi:Ca2+-binding EF-hand superfamily protein
MGNRALTKDLNDNEVRLLVESTHFDEERIKAFYDSFIQDCPSGKLTKKDFTKMFKIFQPSLQTYEFADKYCEYVFK